MSGIITTVCALFCLFVSLPGFHRMRAERTRAETPHDHRNPPLRCEQPYFKAAFHNPTRYELGTMVAILEIGAFSACCPPTCRALGFAD